MHQERPVADLVDLDTLDGADRVRDRRGMVRITGVDREVDRQHGGGGVHHVERDHDATDPTDRCRDAADRGRVASDDLEASWDGDYQRWTNTSAKTLNVRTDATHALPTAGQWHIRNVGANNLTITPAGGVTITPDEEPTE
jgi:hypothetical protein